MIMQFPDIRTAGIITAVALSAGLLFPAQAQIKTTLDAIDFSVLPGDRVQIELRLSGAAIEPKSFSIHDPARIALDLPGVSLNLPRRVLAVGTGPTHSVMAAEAGNRARVVIHLIRYTPYRVKVHGNSIFITIGQSDSGGPGYAAGAVQSRIEDITFEKGESGTGRVHIVLSDPSPVIETRRESGRLIIEFLNTELPERLARVLDVTDFATPIMTIDAASAGDHSRMVITTTGESDHLIYRADNLQTIDFKRQGNNATNSHSATGDG